MSPTAADTAGGGGGYAEDSLSMYARTRSAGVSSGANFLGNDILEKSRGAACGTPAMTGDGSAAVATVSGATAADEAKKHAKKKGALTGVFVPTCENMWGVLIFLRFYWIVGEAGVAQTLCVVALSFAAALCTTASMSSIASSGGIVSRGGPYHMISRALGPEVGGTVGIMYWLAITLLAVLETLGAVESLVMAVPSAGEIPFHNQAIGSAFLAGLALTVWGGVEIVTRLGLVFALVVFYTLFSFYYGLSTAPHHEAPLNLGCADWVTGLSSETFWKNWGPHYSEGNSFGTALALFYPCFTGILSGANRADVLKDPPKHIRRGTFAAITFSFFMYASLFILWGAVADYRYLQGKTVGPDGSPRDEVLDGTELGRMIVAHIVWNPFPKAAFIGIIVASLSQSLQCLIVAPRLLQQIAKDDILGSLKPFAPLSSRGEPTRALIFTYLVAAAMVLIGSLDAIAPLLAMCFLTAYAFMNISCFMLTVLRSPAWRPDWIHRKRWRYAYLCIAGFGFVVCLVIMFEINRIWALIASFLGVLLYGYINWKIEARDWGSAVDGIQVKLALNALINLEASQHQCVNWRPNVLILYRINLTEELQGIKHREILRFYSQLRKSRGFCVVACVLESERRDEATIRRAGEEKGVIKRIMEEEGLQGFAEVVVAPTWSEGTNYIVQLTGIGGLVPNTVLLDWPESEGGPEERRAFVEVLQTALGADKAVLAVKGLREMPIDVVHGTIDIWWMIHDGGFLILLSWLLSRHRTWRGCQLRVFTIAENVSPEQAQAAAEALSKTLRQRRLLNVDVEVIILDDELIAPYTHDWTLRVEDRHRFLRELAPGVSRPEALESIPLEIDDLFNIEPVPPVHAASATSIVSEAGRSAGGSVARSLPPNLSESATPRHVSENPISEFSGVTVSDFRKAASSAEVASASGAAGSACAAAAAASSNEAPAPARRHVHQWPSSGGSSSNGAASSAAAANDAAPAAPPAEEASPAAQKTARSGQAANGSRRRERRQIFGAETCERLGQIVHARSMRSELVVMNLPDVWSTEGEDVEEYMKYCDMLTQGIERVLFVHSTGREIFDISE